MEAKEEYFRIFVYLLHRNKQFLYILLDFFEFLHGFYGIYFRRVYQNIL